ncbi:MAG: hypothetical protein JXJ22_15995, partial [Bacteroidales bacterium]|nr:hypothetical protein [Bacteroidales bacterium]
GIRFIAASLPPEVTLENLKAYIESKDKNNFYNLHQYSLYYEAIYMKFIIEIKGRYELVYHKEDFYLMDITQLKE